MHASLVEKAKAGDIDAFGELVTRFQDMACGCAYAVLGDFHLAQDAAQEAFLEAYRSLPRIKDPNAFPGWFRRIVLHRCNRLARRKSVPAQPIDAATAVASPRPSPAAAAERRELRDRVLAAIRGLPENDRMVTALYYINGYSQQDVADFLEVPVTTVNNHLHSARERLKERMVAMVEDELKSQRPGPELRKAVVDELMGRKARFDRLVYRRTAEEDTEAEQERESRWAKRWHDRRMEDVRANAAQYGIEPDEELPRMQRGYRQSETFRDDFTDIPRRWGVPEGTELVSLRDFCRLMGTTPLAIQRWEGEGLQILHYHPWQAFDRARASAWVKVRDLKPDQQLSEEDGRELLLLALRAVASGEASVTEGLSVFHGLEMNVGQAPGRLKPDAMWVAKWQANRETERKQNAKRYGLEQPTPGWLGIPRGLERERVFEIRDVTRRLGLSPFDMIKWTNEGMPALRYSPYIRWDVEHVAQWLAERGPLPKREYTIKELDSLEDFVIESVAAGEATPEEGRDVLACWVGTM